MRIIRIAGVGIEALAEQKFRTFLMMLGTLIGVAALTVVMAMGKGAERKIMKRVQNFGVNAIMIPAGGGKRPGPDMSTTTLTPQDAEAIRRDVSGLRMVSPMAWNFRMNLKRDQQQYQAVVWGVEPSWHDAWRWYTASGDGITADDLATQSRVCVIGQTVKKELFGEENPIGQHIYIGRVRLQVKGVLAKRGASPMGGDFDNRVILPLTTAMRRVMNVDHLGAIRVILEDTSQLRARAEEIRQILRARHHIVPPKEEDFRIITGEAITRFATGSSRTLSILLTVLAGLSLLVGGVVLMNILLISVKRRTKEIGLRRALGATESDVFTQFLVESLTVTLLGMIAGLAVGWGACTILPRFTKMPIVISWEPVAMAAVAALVVGTFFGIQPARQAARLNPVEALR
ncbi:MAG: ABC transporter permease [Planctomycetes bacterium]|nr:ABC transporter permease [Planctomycetota bacterium]